MTTKATMAKAAAPKTPEITVEQHAGFYLATLTASNGIRITVRKAQAGGTHYPVSVDGRRVDSFLSRSRALRRARALCAGLEGAGRG
jgi:hypothetical protein